jgi:4-alpha-glucanotransferase
MVANRKKSPINASSRILGDKTFSAITAVEGLKLSAASKKRMSAMKAQNLTPAQKRAEVLRAYSHSKGR